MATSEPRPNAAPARAPWWAESLLVTFSFRCNLACRFCMVEDALGREQPFLGTTLEAFRAFVEGPEAAQALHGKRRIVFSGGEVTLSKELPRYVELARALPGIEHVRIQTNATRLADRALLSRLVASGLDEVFVSLHAPSAAVYDPLVQVEGAFEQIVAGLDAIRSAKLSLTTNTAIVAANVASLPDIPPLAHRYGARSVEFWNHWPRTDPLGDRGLHAPLREVVGPLRAALARARSLGMEPVVKWVPRCLLGPDAVHQDDGQPPALIDDGYWDREPEYACLYEGVCSGADEGCAGLSHSYIERWGWEENLLVPLRRAGEAPRRDRGDPARSLVEDETPERAERARLAAWLEEFGLGLGAAVAGHPIVGVARRRGSDLQPMVLLVLGGPGPEAPRFEVRIALTEPTRRAFARTPSFDVHFTKLPAGGERQAARIATAVATSLRAHDRGGRTLP